jgi:cyclic pyranopterin phosphate synthase
MAKNFSHLNARGLPTMVDVSEKSVTQRTAIAESIVQLPAEIVSLLNNDDITTKKGPVFQTAILAGIMAIKKTSELIPLCHPLPITKSDIAISIDDNRQVVITSEVKVEGKTGVEMEALTGASVAALTIYDMCKGFSQDIVIKSTRLIKKTGGKSDYER